MGNGASIENNNMNENNQLIKNEVGENMNTNNVMKQTNNNNNMQVTNNVIVKKEADSWNIKAPSSKKTRSSLSFREQIKRDRAKFAKENQKVANSSSSDNNNNNDNMKKQSASATNNNNAAIKHDKPVVKHPYLRRYQNYNKGPIIVKCKLNCGMEYPETKSGLRRHEKICPKFEIRCTIPGCKESMLREELDQHVAAVHRRKKSSTKQQSSGLKPWQKKNINKNKNNNNNDDDKPWRRKQRGNGKRNMNNNNNNNNNNKKDLTITIHNKNSSNNPNDATKKLVNNINDILAKVLVHPTFLEYNYIADSLKLIKYTSKELISLYDNVATSTYASISVSLANSHGLFLPTERSGRVEWKTFFHNNLWPSRKKWIDDYNNNEESTEEGQFKINVATRFRPGERSKSRLSLPLHQFLKMRRAAKKDGSMPTIGGKTKVPDRFKDEFTGVLMSSPIQLPSSKKFMDRKTLLKSLKRDPHDPFDGSSLTPSKVIECPELKKMIRKHVEIVKNLSEEDKDMKVSMAAVETMAQADGGNLTSEMIEALMDAERLERAIEKAERKSAENNNMNNRRRNDRQVFIGDDNNNGENIHGMEDNNNVNLQDDINDVNFIDEDFRNLNVNDDGKANNHSLPGASKSSSDNDDLFNKNNRRKKEQARVISVQPNRINMYVPGAGVRPFTFTKCFDEKTSQSELYLETGRNVVLSALNGFNSALLTYGQTGSGKTYTIYGGEGWVEKTSTEIDTNRPLTVCGIAVRAMSDIFDSKNSMKTNKNINMNISVQYVQIYNDEVFDLGTGNPVTLRKSNGQLVGSSQFNIDNVKDFFEILRMGEEYKHYAETKMNHRSSRAHTILIVTITQNKIGTDSLITSQLQMVDLAGSERIKKSKVVGAQRVEAVGINYSLLCLGKVIKSLVEDSTKHVPYFESKLTTLLKGAFGGNSITSAIITCRINDENAAETLQALYFGERCSMITNTTRNAVVSKDAALQAIDQALETCKHGIIRLEEKGKQHLNVYKELVARSQNLQIKRNALML